VLRLHNVHKRYMQRGRNVAALENVNLEIAAGQYVAVVGPSGSGKSTLLSVLGGMMSPTGGEVLLDGRSLYAMTARQRAHVRCRRFGFVFQTFHLIPYLSALENVQAPMMLAGLPPPRQREHATRLLERFGLAERVQHRPSELSVGQQQRVAMARTLANDPDVILADEPTGNLDPSTRDVILEALAEFHAEGRTIIVVTHDPGVARRAERQLRLADGRVSENEPMPLRASA
jgi:putative ABC transport system ATP-binding protein